MRSPKASLHITVCLVCRQVLYWRVNRATPSHLNRGILRMYVAGSVDDVMLYEITKQLKFPTQLHLPIVLHSL